MIKPFVQRDELELDFIAPYGIQEEATGHRQPLEVLEVHSACCGSPVPAVPWFPACSY